MRTYTISQLAREFQITRTTLLYYDKIGLLKATARSVSNYRFYSEKDRQKLSQIRTYRSTGLSLKKIHSLLTNPRSTSLDILKKHLGYTHKQIGLLRIQQQSLIQLLKQSHLAKLSTRIMSKKRWISFLRAAGLTEKQMMKWHETFEKNAPEAHEDFLQSLGLSDKEILRIRMASGFKKTIKTL